MFSIKGNSIRMKRDDFGTAIPFRFGACGCCGGFEDDDIFTLTVTKANETAVKRSIRYRDLLENDMTMEVSLTREETEIMDPGLYGWEVRVIGNEGDMGVSVMTGNFFVEP